MSTHPGSPPTANTTTPLTWQIHHCQSAACGLRYPVVPDATAGQRAASPACARCRGPVRVTFHIHPRTAETQHDFEDSHAVTDAVTGENSGGNTGANFAPATPLCGLIDNLRSAFNVGSVLRIADGAGFAHVHLCGISATPQQAKVRKTALGAEASVPWTYHPNAVHAATQLRDQGWQLVALETGSDAHPLFAAAGQLSTGAPLALMVGNEVTGLDPQLLELADTQLAIPMHGEKESLNVAVAFGIAAYWLRGSLRAPEPVSP